MLLKDFINELQQLDGDIEIRLGLENSEWCEPAIEPTEDVDTQEYYYRIVGE